MVTVLWSMMIRESLSMLERALTSASVRGGREHGTEALSLLSTEAFDAW